MRRVRRLFRWVSNGEETGREVAAAAFSCGEIGPLSANLRVIPGNRYVAAAGGFRE